MSNDECLVDVVSNYKLLNHSAREVTPNDAKLVEPGRAHA